jgi:2-amino-4-hydroxy-6-hydroxymethyldihydropteridine diphosphokinase
MAVAYLSLGSNIAPEKHLRAAIHALRAQFGQIQLSQVYRTVAVGFNGDDFLNATARIETDMQPRALDAWLHALEDAHGRQRNGPRFSSRTLDIDLLLYGDVILHGPGHLQLPRPELETQAFVLKPMLDLVPDLVHPTRGVTLRELYDTLDDKRNFQVVLLDKTAS